MFPNVKGPDNANAQGQATIRIETTICVILEGSINYHPIPAAVEINRIITKK